MGAIDKMEKKYSIRIRDDSYYNPLNNKYVKRYKIYTADGCSWDNNLTFRGVQKECRENGNVFKKIAKVEV